MDDRPARTPARPAEPPPRQPGQAPAPGERRLERPPSDRYRAPEPSAEPAPEVPARGIAIAAVVAISGAIAIALAGGIVTMTAGLVVIAGLVGWGTAVALRAGGAGRWSRGRRAIAAAILALAGVGLGQVGLWLLARQEGGVLALVDYLGEAFGILVPLELGIAAVTAWLASR